MRTDHDDGRAGGDAVGLVPAGAWSIDSERSTVGFSLRHLLVAPVRGRFHDFDGVVSRDADGRLRASGTVQVSSIDTGNAIRDERLRGSEFFDAQAYPEVRFTASSARALSGGRYLVAGELSLHGVAREIELVAEPEGDANGTVHLRARGELSRAAFGIVPDSLLEAGVSDTVRLALDITATRQP